MFWTYPRLDRIRFSVLARDLFHLCTPNRSRWPSPSTIITGLDISRLTSRTRLSCRLCKSGRRFNQHSCRRTCGLLAVDVGRRLLRLLTNCPCHCSFGAQFFSKWACYPAFFRNLISCYPLGYRRHNSSYRPTDVNIGLPWSHLCGTREIM
jgi:hypothetical protein